MVKVKSKLVRLSIVILTFSMLMLILTGCGPRKIDMSEKTPHIIGSFEKSNEEAVMHSTKGQTGFLVFGPYWDLKPGNYNVTYKIKVEGTQNQEAAIADVSTFNENSKASSVLKQTTVVTSDKAEWKEYSIDFTVQEQVKELKYEFRVFSTGNTDVKTGTIVLKKL